MDSHWDYVDNDFLHQFQEVTFPPELFTHEAHIRLAWILLRRLKPDDACGEACHMIARFDNKFGDGTKYHCTLTCAAIRIVHHFMTQCGHEDFHSFIQSNQRLITEFRHLIYMHYSAELLDKPHSRKEYVSPDIIPF